MGWEQYIPQDIIERYEIHDYLHAAVILSNEFPDEFEDICEVLREFSFSKEDVIAEGGCESNIPKKFSAILRPRKWEEKQLKAKVIVDDKEFRSITHKVDYFKGRIAFDLEWNSKDQTYDRDLITFKTFFEYNKISVAILVTRSNDLDEWFKTLGSFTDKNGNVKHVSKKYGASTTRMSKLLPRMESGRHGGCPVLIFGITPKSCNN